MRKDDLSPLRIFVIGQRNSQIRTNIKAKERQLFVKWTMPPFYFFLSVVKFLFKVFLNYDVDKFQCIYVFYIFLQFNIYFWGLCLFY